MSDADSIAAGFGRFASAGGSSTASCTPSARATAIREMTDADWDAAFALGTMSGCALDPRRAADAACRRWARIVTLSAIPSSAEPRIVAYTASKAALSSVTKNLSKSLAKDGILVNCVCPGTIVTASFTENLKDILAADGLDARIRST